MDEPKIIPLNSRKYPGLYAVVDSWAYEELSKYSWHPVVKENNKTIYVQGVVVIDGHKRTVQLHRFVLHLAGIQVPDGMQTDHIDFNGLNNTLFNLQVVTPSQNMQRRRKRAGSSSKFLGVLKNTHNDHYRGQIRVKGVKYSATFHKEEHAAMWYDAFAIEEYGHYANPNFPGLRSPESQLEYFYELSRGS